MKHSAHILFILFLGLVLFNGCITDPVETCEQEEFCSSQTVTACCEGDDCYYTYNGKRYEDDSASLARLASDLGCTSGVVANNDADLQELMNQIEILKESARIKSY